MGLTSGSRLGAYEIQSPLGAGGMGEVYRATDTKLGRDVALKVLPAGMAHDAERLGRFRREAKVLAQLDHPNIVTIYSVEESDGVHFLTMQLVDGQPLDRIIPQDGLPIERIVEIGSAMADALAAAHEKGIVHRDLKPANVMVNNEGRVKVLDFGLAKDVRAANPGDATLTSASNTQVGVVMGTPAYMSPEQTSGRPLDHRTDIFSLGVVLHEMSTGRRPFEGTSSAELISAILRDNPPSVTESRPDLPGDLARIIRRCLEKDPRHRMQTARDVSNEFRDMSRTASRPAPVSTSSARAIVAPDSAATRAAEGFWVAVLPFRYGGGNADLTALAGGLTDDIVTGMSRFSYLRVIARASTTKYSSESGDVRAIGKELGARYVMEGNLRQAGTKLRLAVQLVDAVPGIHVWAENYERTFSAENIFALQDDLVPRIVSTVADYYGVLPHTISNALRGKADDQLAPHEAVLRAFSYFERITPEEHAQVRQILERAVRSAPDQGEIWAMLSTIYWHEHAHGFNPQPDSLQRALAAARRSVDAAPTNNLGYSALATTFFFQKNILAFRPAAERAIELNPLDGSNLAHVGILMAYAGDWEHGCALVESALQLNPHHPGWYWFAHFMNAYRKGDYRGALSIALKFNLPGYFFAHALTAAVYGQLGLREPARKALQELLTIRPDFAVAARKEFEKVYDPELVEHLVDGLSKAGLEIAPEKEATVPAMETPPSPAASDSGAVRADQGFWVAVLPFKPGSPSQEIKALADGISEEIVAGLSRFSYLRVITSGSTQRYHDQSPDLRAVGKELGARYVMSGNLRQVGARLRVAAQLVDAATGAQLWSETYERPFSAETVFELQDDLAARIAATVGDAHGILAHSMSEALRDKAPDQLTPYEAVLRSFGYGYRCTPEEHATVRDALEAAVQRAPGYADAWAMLALVYVDEFSHGTNLRPDPLGRALQAAQRAVDSAPSSAMAYNALAWALFFRKEFQAFRNAAAQSVELNPLNSPTLAGLGAMTAYAGDWERGCALAERALELNPRHPGWYWFPLFYNAYRKRDYRGAVIIALKLNLPHFFVSHEALAAAYGQLGDHEAASKALREVLRLKPDYPAIARERLEKWFDPEVVEHVMDGLRKAGLETANDAARPAILSGATSVRTVSGESRAADGFWIAVLPFKYTGSNSDLRALAEGLSEEVITGLSRFSYLRVMAHGSSENLSSELVDAHRIGKELGARYVMQGSMRQAGSKVRLAVQLVDTVSGTHLWAETYERAFAPESVFEVQDELVPRIVSTVADQYGVLPRSMSEVLRTKSEDELTPHEAVLRTFSYFARISSEEHAAVRRILERAVREAPDHADSWAMLSMMYRGEFAQGYNTGPNPLDRALAAAQRAVDLAPAHALGHYSLATVHFFRKEMIPFRVEAERALTLNPLDASVKAYLGLLIAAAGEWDRGCQMVESAMQLNPNCPGYFYFAGCWNAYRQGKYADVLEGVARINMPNYFHVPAIRAAALGQLGRREEARRALQNLLALRPDFAAAARQEYAKWYDSEQVEHMIDGLRKAGLEISDKDGN